MSQVWLTIIGILLLALALYDIYATILRATKRTGPVSEFLNRGLWLLAAGIAKRFPRRSRHRILTAVGTLLMPLMLILLVFLLIVGFALIYMPHIGDGFTQNEASRLRSEWLQALYFSGVTLLTIGYGDIVPRTWPMRLVAILQGLSGIGLITLGVTYLLTVYRALERKRAVALNFYHQAGQGADVASFVTRHFSRGQFYGLTDEMKTATRDLQELLETHIEHPVIHYFHPLEVYKSLPRTLFVVLEAVAIIRNCLSRDEYIEAGDHPDILTAADNARYVLAELTVSLNLEKNAQTDFETPAQTLRRRQNCFNRTIRDLQAAQIQIRSDLVMAFQEYSADRAEWERQLYHFADFLGYDWDEITGDRNLEDATDDEIIERHKPLTTSDDD